MAQFGVPMRPSEDPGLRDVPRCFSMFGHSGLWLEAATEMDGGTVPWRFEDEHETTNCRIHHA
jgi:hypothetical protein